jgi:hypothetical protein
MATSGTVGQTVFETRKVIDHAFRRCKVPPQGITSENIDTALDLLFLNLSALATYGIPLWVIEKTILPIYRGQRSVPLPVGTVDVMNFNIRDLNRTLGSANTASEGIADNAFDSDLSTSVVQTLAGGFLQVDFGANNAVQVDNYGIFFTPAATEVWDITIQGSQNGIAFTNLYTNAALNAVPGDWFWLDLEEQVPWRFIRLQANGATILNLAEFFLGNTANEIPMPKISRDSYSNLPDKTFLSRPTEYWFDKQAVGSANNQSIATVWPVPDTEFTFYQYVLYVKRQIQDVGTMQQQLEVPQRWYEYVICDLARKVCRSVPEADDARIPLLDGDFEKAKTEVWTGEDDGAPVRLQPRISVYTK